VRAVEILEKVCKLVGGDRNAQHGDILSNGQNIARLWTAYLQMRQADFVPLKASEVFDLMELLKVARRQSGRTNMDDYMDGAGYAGCAGEARFREGEEDAANKTVTTLRR